MKHIILAIAMTTGLAFSLPAQAQTAADVDAAMESVFGAHAPYRQFFEKLQAAVSADDKRTVASMIEYPFQARIGGKAVKLRDAEHFIADYDKVLTPAIKQTITAQPYDTLFVNWQGVSIGDGELWFSGIGGNRIIKITAING